MSGDAPAVRYGLPSSDCRLCDGVLGPDDQQILQSYHVDDQNPFDEAVLGLCPDCRGDVAELVDTWTTVSEPPVDDASIAAGYHRVTDRCSFCEQAVAETPVVGLEYYRAGADHDDGLSDVRHFALCPHCVGVFSEFLDSVATE